MSFLLMTSCVSVNLSGGKVKKADNVKYFEPQPPFLSIDNQQVDKGWQNKNNGNTIAFLSECNSKTEISLKMMETESLSSLANLKVLKSEVSSFNDRESLSTLAEGQVDGVQVKLQLLLFKKNDCNYTLSFVGRKKFFDKDSSIFQKFYEEFKAP